MVGVKVGRNDHHKHHRNVAADPHHQLGQEPIKLHRHGPFQTWRGGKRRGDRGLPVTKATSSQKVSMINHITVLENYILSHSMMAIFSAKQPCLEKEPDQLLSTALFATRFSLNVHSILL
ncbi:hypothetical protein CEXT_263781 [Caerostris extrusa]|uniref:Uncharacterized protein n=1 Tax=Caerostris extrusa TaxID=172846 RepID=A0AAV4Q8K6_CAEEX|nr:hypothetical protein CEXT_263781 [Caerostris extrusa]